MADCGWVLVMPDACPFCYGVNLAVEQPTTKPYKIQKSQHSVIILTVSLQLL